MKYPLFLNYRKVLANLFIVIFIVISYLLFYKPVTRSVSKDFTLPDISYIGVPYSEINLCIEKLNQKTLDKASWLFLKRDDLATIFELICKHSINKQLDPELVYSIIYVETKFDSEIKCSNGNCGLMQVNSSVHHYSVTDLYFVDFNIDKGTDILVKCKSDIKCYNGGGNKNYTNLVNWVYK